MGNARIVRVKNLFVKDNVSMSYTSEAVVVKYWRLLKHTISKDSYLYVFSCSDELATVEANP